MTIYLCENEIDSFAMGIRKFRQIHIYVQSVNSKRTIKFMFRSINDCLGCEMGFDTKYDMVCNRCVAFCDFLCLIERCNMKLI